MFNFLILVILISNNIFASNIEKKLNLLPLDNNINNPIFLSKERNSDIDFRALNPQIELSQPSNEQTRQLVNGSRLYKNAVQSVVFIATPFGQGSGVVIDKHNIVTNYHVVEGTDSVAIVLYDSEYSSMLNIDEKDVIIGTVEAIDKDRDLALIKVSNSLNKIKIKKGNSWQIDIADDVFAIGNPGGGALWAFSYGVVSALHSPRKWTYSSGLAGIICASAGNDLYHPIQSMIIAMIGVVIAYKLHYWVERRFKIDDAVGAVAVHGYAGVAGLIICGFVLNGYPSSGYSVGSMWVGTHYAPINPLGMFIGAIVMFGVLGLLPGYIIAKVLHGMNKLRIPREAEIAGLDYNLMESAKNDEKAVSSSTR